MVTLERQNRSVLSSIDDTFKAVQIVYALLITCDSCNQRPNERISGACDVFDRLDLQGGEVLYDNDIALHSMGYNASPGHVGCLVGESGGWSLVRRDVHDSDDALVATLYPNVLEEREEVDGSLGKATLGQEGQGSFRGVVLVDLASGKVVEVHTEARSKGEVVDEVPPPVLIHEVVLPRACLFVDFLQL